MSRKKQIFIIHGGITFKSRRDFLHYLRTKEVKLTKKPSWKGEYLEHKLDREFDIIRPMMPLAENARYEDWRIYFERYIPLMKNGVILVGTSLGGIFLAKYLSEHKFPKKIRSVYLVAPPYDNSHSTEDLVGGFTLKSNLSLLEINCPNLKLFFSARDEVVPPVHAEKYRKKLKRADIIIYKHIKGHFQITEFPEIVKMIKDSVKK